MNTAILAVAALAEEEHHELPIAPIWFMIMFLATFLILALATASFSGRGVVRTENGPADLSPSEREALSSYDQKFHGSH